MIFLIYYFIFNKLHNLILFRIHKIIKFQEIYSIEILIIVILLKNNFKKIIFTIIVSKKITK